MSSFQDMVHRDIHNVFLNNDEYAAPRTVVYDGETYTNIPVVLTGLKEEARHQTTSDHAQGLYRVTAIAHLARCDLGGVQPEKGSKIRISDAEGECGFLRWYYIAKSDCEIGMLRLELEVIDE